MNVLLNALMWSYLTEILLEIFEAVKVEKVI